MSKYLCICGGSKNYPICDESHESAQWSCSTVEIQEAELFISTSVELYNLAQRLAYKLNAKVITEHYNQPVHTLVRLCNVASPYPTPYMQASKTLNITIDLQPTFLFKKTPEEAVYSLFDVEPKYLYSTVLKAIKSKTSWALTNPTIETFKVKNKIFLSHAVRDQPRLNDLINLMRMRYNLDVFICSDSLSLGEEWYSAMIASLDQTDLVVQIITENTNNSTFCAFEAGYSIAAKLPLLLICYDKDVRPPAHLHHIQASEVWKSQQLKPWMTKEEITLSVIFDMLIKVTNQED